MRCDSLGIALPVLRICPVHSLISEHQGVYGVACPEDGQRGAYLRIKHRVRYVPVTLKDMLVLQKDLQAHLHLSSLPLSKYARSLSHTNQRESAGMCSPAKHAEHLVSMLDPPSLTTQTVEQKQNRHLAVFRLDIRT